MIVLVIATGPQKCDPSPCAPEHSGGIDLSQAAFPRKLALLAQHPPLRSPPPPPGASDLQMETPTPRSSVADTVARKKDLTDQLADGLKRLPGEVSGVKARLQSLNEVEEDAEKVKHLGVAETVADYEAKIAAWIETLKKIRQQRV